MKQAHQIPMITYATIGSKGQIVIPKEAREKLDVMPGDRVVFIIEDKRMMIINPDELQQMMSLIQQSIEMTSLTSLPTKKDKKSKKKKKDQYL